MINVVIPSHKRAGNVTTLKIVPSAILCVSESQKHEYASFYKDTEIVTHPDSVIGLIPKRNWMAKHFGELFMLDDDLTIFKRVDIKQGESGKIKEKTEILSAIENLYQMAKLLDVHLFGFGNKITPVMYNEFKPFSLNNCITGRNYGVIRNDNTVWDERFCLKEDFLISCWIKYKEGVILTDNRYTFEQSNTMINPGGLSSIRNKLTEKENCMRLRQWFGESVKLKKQHNNGKDKITDKSEYNVQVNFP